MCDFICNHFVVEQQRQQQRHVTFSSTILVVYCFQCSIVIYLCTNQLSYLDGPRNDEHDYAQWLSYFSVLFPELVGFRTISLLVCSFINTVNTVYLRYNQFRYDEFSDIRTITSVPMALSIETWSGITNNNSPDRFVIFKVYCILIFIYKKLIFLLIDLTIIIGQP